MLRRVLTVFLWFFALVVALAALVAWRGDALLRVVLERALQPYLVPTVAIGGPVEWRLAPRPTVVVRDLALRDAGGETLARVREIAVALADDALDARRLALASIDLAGVALTLRRDGAGRWNAESWLAPSSPPERDATPRVLPIGRLSVVDARVRVEDVLAFEDVRFDIGPVVAGQPAPTRLSALVVADAPVATRFALEASARLHVDAAAPRVADARVAVDGRVGDWMVERAELRAATVTRGTAGAVRATGVEASVLARGQAAMLDGKSALSPHEPASSGGAPPAMPGPPERVRVDARIALDVLAGLASGWSGERLRVAVQAVRGAESAGARLQAERAQLDGDRWALAALVLELSTGGALPAARAVLDGAAQGRLDEGGGSAALEVARGELELPHPAGTPTPLAATFAGALHLDAAAALAHGTLAGSFDDSRFDGRWRVDADATPPVEVVLKLDRLDLDRYLPPPASGAPATDLAVWRNWPVRAELGVDELRVQGLVTHDARLRLLGGTAAPAR